MPKLRPAHTDDAPALLRLVNSVYRGEDALRGWTTEAGIIGGPRTTGHALAAILAAPGQAMLVAETDAGLVGCVRLERHGQVVRLGMLSVAVDAQGSGLGARLLAAGEAYARDVLGARTAELHVLTVRHELLAWYERRGYVDTGDREPFPYGEPDNGTPFVEGLEFAVLTRSLGASQP